MRIIKSLHGETSETLKNLYNIGFKVVRVGKVLSLRDKENKEVLTAFNRGELLESIEKFMR